MLKEMSMDEMMMVDGGAYPIHEWNITREEANEEGKTIIIGLSAIVVTIITGGTGLVPFGVGLSAIGTAKLLDGCN